MRRMHPWIPSLLVLVVGVALFPNTVLSQDDCPPGYSKVVQRDEVKTEAGAPSLILPKKDVIEPIGCRRQFEHKGLTQPVDSYHRQDAERLRRVVQDNPDASSFLNTYRSNKRKARIAAYTGTVGLALALVSNFVISSINIDDKETLSQIGVITGLGVAAGSFVYSFGVLRTNEANLQRSVEAYNGANPSEPITLRFSTGILF